MRRMVATDYDGTLNQGGVIHSDTLEAIAAWRAQGHLFGVVTGRDYVKGFDYFRREARFPFDFVINGNGAQAFDGQGNLLFSTVIDGGRPWGTSTLASALICRLLEWTEQPCGISFERTRLDFHPAFLHGSQGENGVYSPFSHLDGVGDFVMANACCATPEEAGRVVAMLEKEFGQFLQPVQNGFCIDIAAVGVDKGTGVRRLAEQLGILPDDVWVAGDNYNDRTMLEAFHGCAMATGVPELSAIAEHVCDSVADVIKLALQ